MRREYANSERKLTHQKLNLSDRIEPLGFLSDPLAKISTVTDLCKLFDPLYFATCILCIQGSIHDIAHPLQAEYIACCTATSTILQPHYRTPTLKKTKDIEGVPNVVQYKAPLQFLKILWVENQVRTKGTMALRYFS